MSGMQAIGAVNEAARALEVWYVYRTDSVNEKWDTLPYKKI